MRNCIIILAALVCLSLAGCGASPDLFAVEEAVRESEEICASIVQTVQWQLEGNAAYRQMREELRRSGRLDELPADDIEEIRAEYEKLQGHIQRIEEYKQSLAALPEPEEEAYRLTLQAGRDYVEMLEGAAGDLAAIFEYYFGVHECTRPMAEFESAENTTGYYDYSLFAGQLSQVISQTQRGLSVLEAPAYMQDSHKAFLARIDEYQSFCQDFSIAVQLMDPLRIASCNYRMQRLGIMTEQSEDALTDDFNLQFQQVADRLEGPIAQLREEILDNLKKLH